MKGIEGACLVVVDRIAELFNPHLAVMRERLEDPELPDCNSITAYDATTVGLEEWPAIMVVPQLTRSVVGSGEQDGLTETWHVRYALQAFVWVRGDDDLRTTATRYRYTLALREVLMGSRLFGDYELDPVTLKESFSALMQDRKTSATIAGAYLEFDIHGDEVLDRAEPLGLANTITPDTGVLPQHPAL